MALVRSAGPKPPRVMKRRAPLFAALLLAALGALATLPVAAAPELPSAAQEYDLKAAFLFNFAGFVEWPTDAFPDARAPLTIGVLGDDPFGSSLDELVAGETIRNRPLLIRRYRSVEQVEGCQILFVSSSEAERLDQIARALARRSILTVGETKDFAVKSGIIGFELTQRRLRLRINLAAASDARLTISSKLLRQAQIIRSNGNRR